jgi:hypothetical protein
MAAFKPHVQHMRRQYVWPRKALAWRRSILAKAAAAISNVAAVWAWRRSSFLVKCTAAAYGVSTFVCYLLCAYVPISSNDCFPGLTCLLSSLVITSISFINDSC